MAAQKVANFAINGTARSLPEGDSKKVGAPVAAQRAGEESPAALDAGVPL
jgi:hypothetical protein